MEGEVGTTPTKTKAQRKKRRQLGVEGRLRAAVIANDAIGMGQAWREGAKLDAAFEGGRTALTLACDSGASSGGGLAAASTVALLCSLGANPNAVDRQGETPLQVAVRAGGVACVAELLSWGAQSSVFFQSTDAVSAACLKLVNESRDNGVRPPLLFGELLVLFFFFNGFVQPALLEASRYGEVEHVMRIAALGPHVTNYRCGSWVFFVVLGERC